jgi:hypothetical protein
MSMKNSNDTIGNRTYDLLVCIAMPQPTAPPRAPINLFQNSDILIIPVSAMHYQE